MSGAPILETERLLLRGWRDSDYERWADIMGNPAVSRGHGNDAGMTPSEAWREMAMMAGHWALKGFGHWALEIRATGELVGRAGLYYPPDWPALEVGWTVAHEHWGHGYAPEAARAAVAWAHDHLGARHIISLIAPWNKQSLRVAEKLGEEVEGPFSARGHDMLVYGADLPLGSPR